MSSPASELNSVAAATSRGANRRTHPAAARSRSRPAEAWGSTVLLLVEMAQYGLTGIPVPTEASASTHGVARGPASVTRALRATCAPANVHVSFVERLGDRTVSITWRDSTEACYGEQHWMRKTTRMSGVCALSGAHIARGDCVYSPISRTARRPLNCAQMVLAAVLEDLERREAAYCQP